MEKPATGHSTGFQPAGTGVCVAALRAANPTQGDCPQGRVFIPVTTPIGICSPSGGIPYPSLQRNCQGVWQACNTPNTINNGVCVQPSGCPAGFTGTPPNCTTTTTPPGGNTDGDYLLLEPLPCKNGLDGCPQNGQLTKFDTKGEDKLGVYLNIMINLFIGLCAVAAVIMIVIGGIEYSTSELVSGKAAAKDRIQSALLGLLLALCSYLILYTINPDLLNTNFGVPAASLDVVLDPITVVNRDGTVTTFYSSSGGGGGGGKACSVPPNPNNPCHPSHLSCFGSRAEEASRVCMTESGGISQISRSDRLNNGSGPGYSMGIWQINLTVHRIGGLNCPAAFTSGCGPGNVVQSGPNVGHCSASIRPGMQGLYEQCVAAASNPTTNREFACGLFNSRTRNGSQVGFQPWGYSANRCGIPKR
jgi:hypothetical protein